MTSSASISARELDALIENDAQLRALKAHVEGAMDDDPGHDVHHVMRVALWAVRIGGDEADVRSLIAAALLHDIVNVPKNSPDRARASELCAAEAVRLLPSYGFSPTEILAVAEAIRNHSFSRGAIPQTALGRALQDADRLEALGAIGIMRTFSTGARMGARYFDANDPFGHTRPLDDRALSIDHFFTKLLSLPETMRTARGRAEAQRRTTFLHSFLAQLGEELAVPYNAVASST
ncbi:MAG: HD domain-containing protein [Sandaracinaceae bacterium]|nr:HD domain-containing protein [Sandaracinaceae bacterium]